MRFIISTAVLFLVITGSHAANTSELLKIPDTITVLTDSTEGRRVAFNVSATNINDRKVKVTCTPKSGSFFTIGSTNVNCSAPDGTGNSSTGNFNVNVLSHTNDDSSVSSQSSDSSDNILGSQNETNPTPSPSGTSSELLTLPGTITVLTDSPDGRRVAYNASATNINGKKVKVTCAPKSGSFFKIGSTNVNCSAPDGIGGQSKGNFYINVLSSVTDSVTSPDEVSEPSDSTPIAPEPSVEPTPEPEPSTVESEQSSEPTPELEPSPDPTPEAEPAPETEPEATLPTITISWAAPTTRQDGSSLSASEIGGYDIFIVAESSGNDQTINITDPTINEYIFQATAADVYYISISTYDSQGNSSDLSNTVSVSIP